MITYVENCNIFTKQQHTVKYKKKTPLILSVITGSYNEFQINKHLREQIYILCSTISNIVAMQITFL